MQYTKDTISKSKHLFFKLFFMSLCILLLTACGTTSKKENVDGTEAASDASDPSASKPHQDSIIFLDAGHGGKEYGAQAAGIYEKDINLQIVLKVKKILEQNGFEVYTSRDSDSQISLEDRLAQAEKVNADVFISIHQNSLDNDSTPHGIASHCNEEANKKSAKLTDLVQKMVLKKTDAKDRGVTKDSNLYVLQSTDIPSCLIETGFLTSDTEGPLLKDPAYQNKIALGVAEAVNTFANGDSAPELQIPSDEELNAAPENSSANESKTTANESEDPNSTTEPSEKEPIKTTSGEPNPDEKVVYITIDDGPSSETSKLLDILDQYNAKATWFVTAQYQEGSTLKDTLKQIHDRGHAIGVHTFSHEYKSIYSSVDAYMDDYNKMNAIIKSATGESSDIFRFPGGSNAGYNKKIRTKLLQHVTDEGLVYYDWNAFTGDTEGLSKSEMITKAVKECGYNNKAILLMHDVPGRDRVVEALPDILSALQDKGYEFRALDKNVKPIQFEKPE